MATAAPESGSRLRAMGRAFADRNYRLFFAGQGVSLVGTWMSRLATGWLVFRPGGERDPREGGRLDQRQELGDDQDLSLIHI